MKLSIIIPTSGRKEILRQTLSAAITATKHIDAEIVVVNDSKLDIPEVPNEGNVVLITNPKSGVAAARNYGFHMSKGELILFLDNDIIISKTSVDHIFKLHADGAPACFNLNWEYSATTLETILLSPFTRFLSAFQMISFKGWYNDKSWLDNSIFASKSVASFHLSILRKDFLKTQGYNEGFPYAGFEDYDFPLRLKKAGIQFYIDTRVTVCHNEIDRLNLDNWLLNQQRRAYTRKRAVEFGYTELALEYGFFKRMFFSCIVLSDVLFRTILKGWPNIRLADPLYFRLLMVLQASRIYKGYRQI